MQGKKMKLIDPMSNTGRELFAQRLVSHNLPIMRQNSGHAELKELAKKKEDEAKRMHYYKDTVLNQFKKHRDASKTVQKKNKNNIFKDRLK